MSECYSQKLVIKSEPSEISRNQYLLRTFLRIQVQQTALICAGGEDDINKIEELSEYKKNIKSAVDKDIQARLVLMENVVSSYRRNIGLHNTEKAVKTIVDCLNDDLGIKRIVEEFLFNADEMSSFSVDEEELEKALKTH